MLELVIYQHLTDRLGLVAAPSAAELLRHRLVILMHERGMNQTKLASEVGKSPSWLSGFLKGETGIGFDVLDDLARALHVEVPDLFVDRDQLRHGSYVQQVLHPLLKGAPSDPAARATFIREILEAYELLSATLLDIAATAVGGEAPRAEPAQTGHAPRPRIGRGSRIGKLKGRQS